MKRLFRFLPIALLALVGACSDDAPTPEPPAGPTAPFTLKADRTEIEAGGTVTFTVTSSDGTDVTSKCTICSNTTCFASNVVTFPEEGVFEIEGHYMTSDPDYPAGIPTRNKITITVGDAEAKGPFTLSADRTEIEAGETVTFTVTSADGIDVTSKCTVCSNTTCFASNVVTFRKEGVFEIEGHYQTSDPEYPAGIPTQNKIQIIVGGSKESTYTVSADPGSPQVGEPVTFTMTDDDGTDVSQQTRFLIRGTQIEGRSFVFEIPGMYAVSALYMGDPAQPDGVPAKNKLAVNVLKAPVTYTLEADRTESKVHEPVVFTVRSSEGQEANGKFSIVDQNGVSYPYHTKMFMEPGVYTLHAEGRDDPELQSTNTVTVTVAAKSNEVDRSRFYRRSILAELTGTWCGQCPYLARQIDFVQSELLYDRMVVVAVHDPITPSQQGMLGNQYKILTDTYDNVFWGQIPAYTVDWNTDYTTQSWSANPETNGPGMAGYVESSRTFDPLTPGIAVTSSLSGRELTVEVRIASKENSEYFLGMALVEDGIVGYQNSGGDDYVHNHVGQGMITDPAKMAESIGSIASGQERGFTYTYEIPTVSHAHSIDVSKCSIAVWVCKASADAGRARLGFLCSNAVSCPAGSSVDYQYEPVE